MLLFLLLPLSAMASFCRSEPLVLAEVQSWDFRSSWHSHFPLPTPTSGGWEPTKAVAVFSLLGPENLSLTIVHGRAPEEVGLAYNLFYVQVTLLDEPELEPIVLDLTEACQRHGISIFPGSHSEEFDLRLPPRADGAPRALESVRIEVWGRR